MPPVSVVAGTCLMILNGHACALAQAAKKMTGTPIKHNIVANTAVQPSSTLNTFLKQPHQDDRVATSKSHHWQAKASATNLCCFNAKQCTQNQLTLLCCIFLGTLMNKRRRRACEEEMKLSTLKIDKIPKTWRFEHYVGWQRLHEGAPWGLIGS